MPRSYFILSLICHWMSLIDHHSNHYTSYAFTCAILKRGIIFSRFILTTILRFKSVDPLYFSFFQVFLSFPWPGDPSCRWIFRATATVSRRKIVAETRRLTQYTPRGDCKSKETRTFSGSIRFTVYDSTNALHPTVFRVFLQFPFSLILFELSPRDV